MQIDLNELEKEASGNPFIGKFEDFFKTKNYKRKIDQLIESYPDKISLDVDFKDLEQFDFELADQLINNPDYLLEAAKQAMQNIEIPKLELDEFSPHIRIFNLPKDRQPLLRDISSTHLGKLVSIEGVIRQITDVLPKLMVAVWECRRCGNTYRIKQETQQIKTPGICECKHKDFELVPEKSEFIDYQKIQIQEPLEKLRGHDQPTTLDIYISDDLVNKLGAGDRTRFVGILRLLQPKDKKVVYGRFLDSIHLEETQKEFTEVDVSKEDEKLIKEIAENPKVYEMLVQSIAPNIYGHEIIKESIALQLFGGVKKILPNETKIRGNVHLLVVGDPGLAKSALLQSVDKIAPKSIYVAGKSSSGVGLCVGPDSLVLNSNGFKPIKEFVDERFEDNQAVEEIKNAWSNSWNEKTHSINNYNLEESNIEKIWRIKAPEKMYKIKTKYGKELEITPNTPLIVLKDNECKWIKSSEINKGDLVAGVPKDILKKLAENKFKKNNSGKDIRWEEVTEKQEFKPKYKYVYDYTVKDTHNFIANGLIVHNTASAVKDDFGEGGWTLKAGALVLASGGIAMIDEFDKMQCLTPDAKICLENGELATIKEIFEKSKELGRTDNTEKGTSVRDVKELYVLAMDKDMKIRKKKVLATHEYPYKGRILEVCLQSGEKVNASPNHPFFTIKNNKIQTIKAGLLKQGDFVCIPSSIPSEEKSNPDPAVSRMYGYLAGDGNVTYNPPENYLIRFTNKNQSLLHDFHNCCAEAFREPAIYPSEIRDDGVICERINSQCFVNQIAFDAPGLLEKYSDKYSPKNIFHSIQNSRNYLRALFDSEGSVNPKNNQISFSTTSPSLATEVKTLLLKNSILSQVKEKKEMGKRRKSFMLRITDYESLKKFSEKIGFESKLKNKKLKTIVKRQKPNRTIINVIPGIGSLLKEIRLELGLLQKDCGINKITYNNFENGKANISIEKAEKALNAFKKEFSPEKHSEELAEKINFLESLVYGDVLWRKVKSVKDIKTVRKENKISYKTMHGLNSINKTLGLKIISKKEIMEKGIEPPLKNIEKKIKTVKDSISKNFKTLGELKQVMRDTSISEIKIAEELNVNQSTAHRWLEQKVKPPENAFHDISKSIKDTLKKINTEDIEKFILETRKQFENKPDCIYDLTVESCSNFIANNIIVHNSEDRSAMHEAMEQGSYHKNFEVNLIEKGTVKIGEFVENLFEKNKNKIREGINTLFLDIKDKDYRIYTTDFERIYETKISQVSKHKAGNIFYKITPQNGRSITVTDNHPVFVLRNGKIQTVFAEDLEKQDFIPMPTEIPFKGREQDLEVRESFSENCCKEKTITLPEKNSPEFFSFMGYHITDGGYELNRGIKNGINFTNKRDELFDDYLLKVENIFGKKPYVQNKDSGVKISRIISKPLVKYLKNIDKSLLEKSQVKKIPQKLMNGRKEDIALLLKALFDGDGTCYCKGSSAKVSFSTPNIELAKQVQDLLLIFGISSSIHKDSNAKNDYFKVDVSGMKNLNKYMEYIGFISKDKIGKLNKAVKNSKKEFLTESIPNCSKEIMQIMQSLKINQNEITNNNLVSSKPISRKRMQMFIEKISEKINVFEKSLEKIQGKKRIKFSELISLRNKTGVSQQELADKLNLRHQHISYFEKTLNEKYFHKYKTALEQVIFEKIKLKEDCEMLKKIAFGEQKWIKIKKIEKLELDEEWVYDIGIEPEHCFISNAQILHNSVSVAKAGIVTTFKTETSILAAANPKYSRFDPYQSFLEQIDLPPTLISRFDLFFALKDVLDRVKDQEIASHILQTHKAGEISSQKLISGKVVVNEEETKKIEKKITPLIDNQLLQKYIAYARQKIFPILKKESMQAISDFYIELRDQGRKEGSYAATHRQLEGLVRLSEASARVRLSDTVELRDVERAIRLVKTSLEELVTDPETGKIDIDIITSGQTQTQLSNMKKILKIIRGIAETEDMVPVDQVIDEAKEEGIEREKARDYISKLKKKGDIYEPRYRFLKPTQNK